MSFKNKVIYQLYPKSFNDSNGDGVGDIPGIIEKLPYLAKLGIDMIWLNPFYVSPQNDNGYDIADYCSVDPVFGTMEDFEKLVQLAKSHGIDIMLDMVFNHTSTMHEWFQKALAGEKEYQDYYIIRDAKEDGSAPTNWQSKFGGSAWEPFGDPNRYYLHLYDKTQADLDWRNPKVKEELVKILHFWLNKGVRGFRFDVLNVIGKDEVLVDSTGDEAQEKALYTDKPITHEYILYLNQHGFGTQEGIVTVGEMSSTTIENGVLYTEPTREELSMIFSFHHLKVDYLNGEKWSNPPFDFLKLKQIINEWQQGMSDGNGWNALFWNNHDQPRANSRFGDPKNYPFETASMLAQTIHLLRGTPYIYQGEEIGMTDPGFEQIEQYVDIETKNAYDQLLAKGVSHQQAMEFIKAKSRDNSRTPMQWDATEQAGFTTGKAWLDVADNYRTINVENELKNGRLFAYYQKLIQLRKEYPIIVDGTYRALQLDHPELFVYVRELDAEKLLVMSNFYSKEASIDLTSEQLDWANARVLIGNYGERESSNRMVLQPYETVAILFGSTM